MKDPSHKDYLECFYKHVCTVKSFFSAPVFQMWADILNSIHLGKCKNGKTFWEKFYNFLLNVVWKLPAQSTVESSLDTSAQLNS